MLYSLSQIQTTNTLSILEGLRLLCEPGEVYELRCARGKQGGTVSGYFTDLDKMASHAGEWSGAAPGVYLTINPVRSDLLARATNRIERRAFSTTADHEVVRR